jgi:N-acetylglutamate synthase-like GNAT family acetyltransferase
MLVRRANFQDYEAIVDWWKAQGRAILPLDALPVLSFVAEDEKSRVAVCWLYCSDSTVGLVSWFTVNPQAPKKSVVNAVRMMDECVEGAARAAGLKILFQFSGGGGFSRKLLKSGWRNTLVKHDFLMKEI